MLAEKKFCKTKFLEKYIFPEKIISGSWQLASGTLGQRLETLSANVNARAKRGESVEQ